MGKIRKMEKFVWAMLKILHFQHENTHQSEDQDYSSIKHGWAVAQYFAAQAHGKLSAFFSARFWLGECYLSTITKLRNGFNTLLDTLNLFTITINFTVFTNNYNQNCGFSIHCSLVKRFKEIHYILLMQTSSSGHVTFVAFAGSKLMSSIPKLPW